MRWHIAAAILHLVYYRHLIGRDVIFHQFDALDLGQHFGVVHFASDSQQKTCLKDSDILNIALLHASTLYICSEF